MFKVHYLLEGRFVIKPVDSIIPEEFKKVWVDLTLPWVESDSADSAPKEAGVEALDAASAVVFPNANKLMMSRGGREGSEV